MSRYCERCTCALVGVAPPPPPIDELASWRALAESRGAALKCVERQLLELHKTACAARPHQWATTVNGRRCLHCNQHVDERPKT